MRLPRFVRMNDWPLTEVRRGALDGEEDDEDEPAAGAADASFPSPGTLPFLTSFVPVSSKTKTTPSMMTSPILSPLRTFAASRDALALDLAAARAVAFAAVLADCDA